MFDRSRLRVQPLADRVHDLDYSRILQLDDVTPQSLDKIPELAARLVSSKARIMFIGGHVIKAGVQRFLIDMMKRGLITHLAMNGAAAIHDWEFAIAGGTSESVVRYLRTGEFGLWEETGHMNWVINECMGEGIGERLGHYLAEISVKTDYVETSVLAAGRRLGVEVTVHLGIGQDILAEHLSYDAESMGLQSYLDFLKFTEAVEHLDGGIFLNLGSAVAGPEVFLKALAMARNVGRVDHFATAVFDIVDRRDYWSRPFKTILSRAIGEGSKSYFVCGDHRDTVPSLWGCLS